MPKAEELVPWGWPNRTYYIRNLYTSYKINNEDFEKLWQAQDGKCSCNRPFAHPLKWIAGKMGYKPQIDYIHRRGPAGELLPCQKVDIQGLLCRRCFRTKHPRQYT